VPLEAPELLEVLLLELAGLFELLPEVPDPLALDATIPEELAEFPDPVDDADVPELPGAVPEDPEVPPSASLDEESVVLPPHAPARAAAVVAAINAERSLR
jgi:hypothetical protein